jgi:eukaryotic-like serine/threonine-protein kinase
MPSRQPRSTAGIPTVFWKLRRIKERLRTPGPGGELLPRFGVSVPTDPLPTDIEPILDRFEDAWNSSGAPRIEDFLPPPGEPGRLSLLSELARIDLERCWKSGAVSPVAEYLRRFPELAESEKDTCELAVAEFTFRRYREPELAPTEYASHFSRYQTEILARLIAAQAPHGPLSGLPGVSRESTDPAAPTRDSAAPTLPTDALLATPVCLREALHPDAFLVTLTVTEGPHRGKVFSFDKHDTFLVGRSPDVHFSLPEKDPYLSRIHFLVEVNPPLCRILDMDSHSGTLVNGRKVRSSELQHGDTIRAGRTVFGVTVESPGGIAGNTALSIELDTVSLTASERVEIEFAEAPPTVPGYRLIRKLGGGGMGVVYLAEPATERGQVALKLIKPAVAPTPLSVQRFLREVNIHESLHHPGIVTFRETGRTASLLFFAMEYVDGTDASHLLKEEGPMPPVRAVPLACQVLDALAYAHGQGFVHRDVKPANLLVTQESGRDVVKLADFGLARAYQASQLSGLTLAGSPGGTPAFMPPEQVLDFRSVKPAADQYAVAATLYNLLTGSHLYDDCNSVQQLFGQILTSNPVPIRARLPSLHPSLAQVLHRALARKPEDRFADVAALRRALLPFANN